MVSIGRTPSYVSNILIVWTLSGLTQEEGNKEETEVLDQVGEERNKSNCRILQELKYLCKLTQCCLGLFNNI